MGIFLSTKIELPEDPLGLQGLLKMSHNLEKVNNSCYQYKNTQGVNVTRALARVRRLPSLQNI